MNESQTQAQSQIIKIQNEIRSIASRLTSCQLVLSKMKIDLIKLGRAVAVLPVPDGNQSSRMYVVSVVGLTRATHLTLKRVTTVFSGVHYASGYAGSIAGEIPEYRESKFGNERLVERFKTNRRQILEYGCNNFDQMVELFEVFSGLIKRTSTNSELSKITNGLTTLVVDLSSAVINLYEELEKFNPDGVSK